MCLFLVGFASKAQVNILGAVLDENKMPLEGVSITEKNSKNGTISNASGNYNIIVKNANATLVF